jgi:hypothetical protein
MAAQHHLEPIHHKNWSKVITHETIAKNQFNAIEYKHYSTTISTTHHHLTSLSLVLIYKTWYPKPANMTSPSVHGHLTSPPCPKSCHMSHTLCQILYVHPLPLSNYANHVKPSCLTSHQHALPSETQRDAPKHPMPCHATPNDITMPTLVFLPLWSPSPCQVDSSHSSEHHHTRVDPSKHLHTSRPHHATHIVTTMHPHALALFPLSHHVIYTPLDPRQLLDMTMRQGEQVVNQNTSCHCPWSPTRGHHHLLA